MKQKDHTHMKRAPAGKRGNIFNGVKIDRLSLRAALHRWHWRATMDGGATCSIEWRISFNRRGLEQDLQKVGEAGRIMAAFDGGAAEFPHRLAAERLEREDSRI